MLKEFLIVRAYFSGWAVVRYLPEKSAYALFDLFGKYFVKKDGKSIQRFRSNLLRVSPLSSQEDLEDLLRRATSSYMRYWCDTFRSPDWNKERIQEQVTCTNEEFITGPMKRGEGVIVALPHSGNWDLAGAYFSSMGLPLVTVAERLKPEPLFQRFLKHRQSLGMEVLPLDNRAMGTLVQRARSGKLVALVADRDLSDNGIRVNFFGAIAQMPAGPALLAIRTGVPLVTAFVSYTNDGIHIDLKQIEIPNVESDKEKLQLIVQKCADNFAVGIAAHPEDWHMLQRIWLDDQFTEKR